MKKVNLEQYGYYCSRSITNAVNALVNARVSGSRTLIITGAPGTGKTYLAEVLAKALNAKYLYTLLHSWSSDEQLFAGVNITAAVAGDAANVHQPGVLALAAEFSHQTQVVVCLDELDKAPMATENLLLDWLQNGRVPIRPGVELTTNLDNVICVITSNMQREHNDALIRRCRRLRIDPLPDSVMVSLLVKETNLPEQLVKLFYRSSKEISKIEDRVVTVQEMKNLLYEVTTTSTTFEDVLDAVSGWIARTEEGEEFLRNPHTKAYKPLKAAWGEVKLWRKKN